MFAYIGSTVQYRDPRSHLLLTLYFPSIDDTHNPTLFMHIHCSSCLFICPLLLIYHTLIVSIKYSNKQTTIPGNIKSAKIKFQTFNFV